MSNRLTKTFYVQYYTDKPDEAIKHFILKRSFNPRQLILGRETLEKINLDKVKKEFPGIEIITNNTVQPGNFLLGPVEKNNA